MPHAVIWIIDAEQWPRALLRAELIERGYDAVGFVSVMDALDAPPARFPDLIVVESRGLSLTPGDAGKLFELRAPLVLIASTPEGNEPWLRELPWASILHRPVSIGDIAAEVERLLPLGD